MYSSGGFILRCSQRRALCLWQSARIGPDLLCHPSSVREIIGWWRNVTHGRHMSIIYRVSLSSPAPLRRSPWPGPWCHERRDSASEAPREAAPDCSTGQSETQSLLLSVFYHSHIHQSYYSISQFKNCHDTRTDGSARSWSTPYQ